LGVSTEDVRLLEPCTAALAKLAPDDAGLATYEWTLAMLKKDSGAAKRAVAKARASAGRAGVGLESVDRMEAATRRAELTRTVSMAVAAVLAIAAGGLLFGRRREILAALARRSPS